MFRRRFDITAFGLPPGGVFLPPAELLLLLLFLGAVAVAALLLVVRPERHGSLLAAKKVRIGTASRTEEPDACRAGLD